MIRFVIAACCALWLVGPASAQQQPIFPDTDTLRETLHRHMMARNIKDVMNAFGGAGTQTQAELDGLESRVRSIFPRDFDNRSLIRREVLEPGWTQELWAYWSDVSYIYAYVLIHERSTDTAAIQFKFNTSVDELFPNF